MIWDMLNSYKFNMAFSFLLGIGIICVFRPICKGVECVINKPASTKDVDGNVYRMGKDCYEFKTEITECPVSGAIEAFREGQTDFARRGSPIRYCD